MPEPDLSQTTRRFAILANAAAGDKPRSWLAARIAEALFSFARRRCLVATGGRTAMREFLGEKINQGGTADIHAWAPGQVVKLFKEGFPPRLGQQGSTVT